jgi:hypothetical protein
MKYLILIFILIGLVLVAGCSSAPDETLPLSQDQQTIETPSPNDGLLPLAPPAVVATTTTIIPTPVRSTVTPTPVRTVIPTVQPALTSPNTFCGEMVTCGDLPASSGMIGVPSTRCPQINNLLIRHDPRATQCFRNAYTGSPSTTWQTEYTKLLCAKGIGTSASCAKVGATLQPVQRT